MVYVIPLFQHLLGFLPSDWHTRQDFLPQDWVLARLLELIILFETFTPLSSFMRTLKSFGNLISATFRLTFWRSSDLGVLGTVRVAEKPAFLNH